MTTFAVWGRGPSSSPIVRAGEYHPQAFEIARAHNFTEVTGSGYGDSWYVLVDCTQEALDVQTRHDTATIGYRLTTAQLGTDSFNRAIYACAECGTREGAPYTHHLDDDQKRCRECAPKHEAALEIAKQVKVTMNFKAIKPTAAQLKALTIAGSDGAIVAAGGGYWVSGGASLADRQSTLRGAGTTPYVTTTTVYACEARGWLERRLSALPRHEAPRFLTPAGQRLLGRL